jgi:hypothetical protein
MKWATKIQRGIARIALELADLIVDGMPDEALADPEIATLANMVVIRCRQALGRQQRKRRERRG